MLTKAGVAYDDDPAVSLDNRKSVRAYNALLRNQIHQASSILESRRSSKNEGRVSAQECRLQIDTSALGDASRIEVEDVDGKVKKSLMSHTARTFGDFVSPNNSGTFLATKPSHNRQFALQTHTHFPATTRMETKFASTISGVRIADDTSRASRKKVGLRKRSV